MIVYVCRYLTPEFLKTFRCLAESKSATDGASPVDLKEFSGAINQSAQWLYGHSMTKRVLQAPLFTQLCNQLAEQLFFLNTL